MNKRQRLVQERFLDNEGEVLNRLETEYSRAYEDVASKIKNLQLQIDELTDEVDLWDAISGDDEDLEKIKSIIQSKTYQKQYQEALKKQIESPLKDLQERAFSTVSEYLEKCYEDSFIGTMYDLSGQNIPLILPIDQKAMVRAVQLNTKISNGLYSRLGEDVAELKKTIASEVSRGIANGASFERVAQQIQFRMTGTYQQKGGALARAMTISRTEGHRIQCQGAMDACHKAKDSGADVVKQWDSTLDGVTRESHAMVDGEIRELGEKFSNGLMFPGDPSGGAAEVVNCRCALLQRARWALDEDELQTLKDRAAFLGFDKTDRFEEFKQKYLKAAESIANFENGGTIETENISVECQRLLDGLKANGVAYKKVEMHSTPLTESEIISVLSGGDLTSGSCASVGLAYCGQKGGMDVLDFRGGESLVFFSRKANLRAIAELPGVKTFKEVARSSVTAGNKLLKRVEVGKEYYLASGRHAAIVRKTKDGVLQYLELQSSVRSGWINFDGNPRYTLKTRFGENKGYDVEDFMIDVDTIKDSVDLKKLLGYINTTKNKQRKGKYGTIK